MPSTAPWAHATHARSSDDHSGWKVQLGHQDDVSECSPTWRDLRARRGVVHEDKTSWPTRGPNADPTIDSTMRGGVGVGTKRAANRAVHPVFESMFAPVAQTRTGHMSPDLDRTDFDSTLARETDACVGSSRANSPTCVESRSADQGFTAGEFLARAVPTTRFTATKIAQAKDARMR